MIKTMLKLLALLTLTLGIETAYGIDYYVLGVITSSEDQNAVALLKHKPTRKVAAFRLGDAVGSMTLKEVALKHIILEQNKKTYKVMVGTDEPIDNSPAIEKNEPYVSSGASSAEMLSSTEKVGSELRVQEAFKEKLVNEDLTTVLMQAAAEPYLEDGSVVGFKLWEIEKDSIYDRAGFVDGDLITHINGTPLNGAGNAIKTLRSLRNANDVEITYVHKGSEKNLKILIQ